MKIFTYLASLLLMIATMLLLAAGNLAIKLAHNFPKVVSYFTKKRNISFRRKEPILFLY